ncbi:hypothetical protein [Mycoplasmoides alvi]|uniref:hypothetical protein n=1 Tax=Mycoplasmoides alvi TaxID=78580 RepID=UPI00051C277C|nr:hypothetical protein [Mycoplasmoides alvi]
MKKIKLIKFLTPLLGLFSLLGIISPFIVSCAQEQQSSDNPSDNPNQGGDSSGSDNNGSGSGDNSDSNSGSDSTGDNEETIPVYLKEWLSNKQKENQAILKHLVWLYDYTNPSNLDKLITNVINMHNDDFVVTSQQGGKELGLYPYVECSTNQYTPVTEWFAPIVSNNALKDKIFKMDYFTTQIQKNVPYTQSTYKDSSFIPSIENKTKDIYTISIHNLSLCDATVNFPLGDLRTLALIGEQTTQSKTSNMINIFELARVSAQTVQDTIEKYVDLQKTEYFKDISSTLDQASKLEQNSELTISPSFIEGKIDLLDVASLGDTSSNKPFVNIVDSFKKIGRVTNDHLKDFISKLNDSNNPSIYTDLAALLKQIFGDESTLIADATSLDQKLTNLLKEQQNVLTNKETSDDLGQGQAQITIPEMAKKLQTLLHNVVGYYYSLGFSLYNLMVLE